MSRTPENTRDNSSRLDDIHSSGYVGIESQQSAQAVIVGRAGSAIRHSGRDGSLSDFGYLLCQPRELLT
jgi:hypothetical protein